MAAGQNCSRQAQFVERIYGGRRGAASRGTDVETLENARFDLSADNARPRCKALSVIAGKEKLWPIQYDFTLLYQ